MSYGKQKSEPTELERYYINWFTKMMTSRSDATAYRKNDERMYFADVDDNRSQFTNKQLKFIAKKFDIPISTKIAYPIIEQMLSFLTGAKPYPRLIATTDATGEFSKTYEKAHNGVWYESQSNLQLTQALRDMLVTGSGYMHVRRNNFYGETTFNVRQEYLPWTDFYVDPSSRRPDFSDAEMMCIAQLMTKSRAENEFGIKISDDDCVGIGNLGIPAVEEDVVVPWVSDGMGGRSRSNDHAKYVWTRRFYEKKEVIVYVNENGDVSAKSPKPIEAPNPALAPLDEQIMQLTQQLQELRQAGQGLQNEVAALETGFTQAANPQAAMQPMMKSKAESQSTNAQRIQLEGQLMRLKTQRASEPEMVPAYDFVLLSGVHMTSYEVRKVKQKKIKTVLMIGSTIKENDVLPVDEYPIIHFCFSHMRRPDKTYGMMHFIRDLNKAMNKFWALAIYDMQTNSSRKILVEENAITNQKKMEEAWAMPNAFLTYKGDPSLPNGGAPTVIEPSPLNQAVAQLIGLLQQMCEYITGMHAIIQGNGDRSLSPDTAGGIQSTQTFGTQRMKLYARFTESSLERLAYVTVAYLQQYAPRDMVIKYLDDDNNESEVQVMATPDDLRFKVRINLTSSLPTVRHQAATILATIIGQHGNPAVADMLTKYMLKVSDIPDAEMIAEQLDAVIQLQGQLQQAQQSNDDMQKRIKMLEQQAYQSDLARSSDIANKDIEREKALATERIRAAEEQQKAGSEETISTEDSIVG